MDLKTSFCRICIVSCPVDVAISDGRVVKVAGDRTNHITGGYTCVKGRAQPAFYDDPARLRRSLKRLPNGEFQEIPVEDAMDEIAERIRSIVDAHGPRSLASYVGTAAASNAATHPFLSAFMNALGSPLEFSSNTIDKPGKYIARAILGQWMAPMQGYNDPKAGLLIGLNPFVSYQGLPHTNPGKWLSEAQARGFKLIVIDPRRNDIARRAFLHLQPRPGHDAAILAGMVHVILQEGLFDHKFVEDHTTGFDELRRAVQPFDPDIVAQSAGIPAQDLVLAARTFANAGRGYAFAGTGPAMSGPGTLNEYLTQVLITICGYYLRAGEQVLNPRTLSPQLVAIAQAAPPKPAYGFGERLRVRGLANTAAGLPVSALADEALLGGDGQVRALISCCGNPVAAWPDQHKTVEAMKALDLLVQIDPWMSQTARLADYVIAPKIGFEIPAISFMADFDASYAVGYGRVEAWGQYSEALVAPPSGSDVIEDWEFFYGVARRLDLTIELEKQLFDPLEAPIALDMARKPTSDEVLELLTRGSRIPLSEVKRHPRGKEYPDPCAVVQPAQENWTGRLNIGDHAMMKDLVGVADSQHSAPNTSNGFDLRLICRRATHVYNSSWHHPATHRGRPYNPLFMHPLDMVERNFANGQFVRIRSERSFIPAIVEPDPSLRRGVVAMTHEYGGLPDEDAQYRAMGSSTSRLLWTDSQYDPYSGQPLMSNVPVEVIALSEAECAQMA